LILDTTHFGAIRVPLNIPDSAAEIVQRAKVAVQRALPGSNPFLKNSWLGALITGLATRIYDFYLQLQQVVDQALPDTATTDYLERWAAVWGINRQAATVSTGNTVITGTVGSIIPLGTILASSDGLNYESTDAATIVANSVQITSLTRSGATVTATTVTAHGLSSYVPVTIVGAVESGYNGVDVEITVTGEYTFTYVIDTTPTTPATGTIFASYDSVQIPVTSQEFGSSVNQAQDAKLTLQSPIAGVDNDSYVDFGAIGGGVDQEDDDALRSRMLYKIQNPVAHFNVAEITNKAKEVPGVTRVFVEEATPAPGRVTIYFMRDNDTDPIPSVSEIETVLAKISTIKPAEMSISSLYVKAPTAITSDFTFTEIVPDTTAMRTAIENNLAQFFEEETTVGVDVSQDAYRAAIQNTIDTVSGSQLSNFTLSVPIGTITVSDGKIPVLGTITFS
jgi:uncharacterized phage protein gp47/JayE